MEDPAGGEGVGRAGVGHAFPGVVGSWRGTDTLRGRRCHCGGYELSATSPRTSVLLRCGDAEGVGGEGGAGAGGGCLGSGSPVADVEGTAGEEAAAAAEEEEVGRFWKYCSPGSSSSRAPHGYACRGRTVTMATEGEEAVVFLAKCEHRLQTSLTCSSSSSSGR